LAPHALILVRSRYKLHTDDFAAKGVYVVGDEEQVGAVLAQRLLQWIEETPPAASGKVPPAAGDAATDAGG
jgi:hypothetical protein